MFAQDVCEAVTIRGAEDADVDALHAYLVAIAAERLPVLFARSDLPARERVAGRIARNANDARYLLLLAVDRDGVAGMLDFVGNPAAQQLHVGGFGMSVRRECRGQGIGRHLIHALLTWTRPRGYRRIELEVFSNNPDAIRLYEREGFVHEGRRRGAVMVGDTAVDLVMMARAV
jgi:RimJ/RimL family protein N-acetyltransferase